MHPTFVCANCQRTFPREPTVKNQRYCGAEECQRARKRIWQQQKLVTDPDYKANQRACQAEWNDKNPGYYREYRQKHSQYCERNRILQRLRNARARPVAKMDASKPAPITRPGTFYLVPLIAKMDASAQKIVIIPLDTSMALIAKEDSIASGGARR